METFFVLVLLVLLAAGAWGTLTVARRFEAATTIDQTHHEGE